VSEELSSGTVALLVRSLRDEPTFAQDFIDWAVQALSRGCDSDTLRLLAGSDLGGLASGVEAEAMFRRCLDELGVNVPDRDALLRLYVGGIASDIVDGACFPEEGVERIHREVLTPFNHPTDLMAWCYLSDGVDPHSFRSLEGQSLTNAIREAARAWALDAGRTTRRCR
jgi:hypothetical protein